MSNELFEHRGRARQVDVAPWVVAHEGVLEVAKERAKLERREGTSLLFAFREKVATAETESAWIEAAKGRRVREVEQLVSAHARGDHPTSAPRPELEKHVLRFEVSAETLAAFRDAVQQVHQASGEKLDDDSTLLLLARAALSMSAGGGTSTGAELGRANYQVSVIVCDRCHAVQPSGADLVEISPATLEAARCDAQTIDLTHGSATHGESTPPRATQTVPPAVRRQVLLRDHRRCQAPGCRNTLAIDVHHIQPRSEAGTHHAHNQLVLCTVHHRAIHEGKLHLSGRAPAHLVFRHADGTPYGPPLPKCRAG